MIPIEIAATTRTIEERDTIAPAQASLHRGIGIRIRADAQTARRSGTNNELLSRRVQDASLAAALVDRILHHGEVFYLKGPAWRLKGRSPDGELVAVASASSNGADGGLDAQHRAGGPEDALR